MKKIIYVLLFWMLITPVSVFASQNSESNAQQGQTNSNNVATSTVTSTTQNQNQAETQVQTNNPDVGTMTQEQTRTQLEIELQKSQPTYTPTRQTTQTRLDAVSQVVENLVTFASRLYAQNQSLSIEVRTTAQEQIKAEDIINQSLDKAESRNEFSKFFIGPDYKQLKNVKKEMEQNKLRIQQLNQIMSQISNMSDQTELTNQIKVLELQNTSLEEQLNQDIKGFALFGWLSKLINKF